MSLGIKDANSTTDSTGVLQMGVPAWAQDYAAGAAFALSRQLQPSRFNVDGNAVEVAPSGRTMNVALKAVPNDVFASSYALAERVLDLLAVEAYRVSTLHDPLREHCTWWRSERGTTLRCLSTARLAIEMKSAAVVRTPDGQVKPQPSRPPQRWHASHAYFRRSQTTDNLDDSYRYLFLALESLLSEVYPWTGKMRENAWLKAALRHVAEGYELDLVQYLEKPAKDPYRRFMKEQYHAQRCALFHAKLSENPRLPGANAARAVLADATRRLGRLYVRLASLVTGAAFAGSAVTDAGFEKMMEPVAASDMYISADAEFSLNRCLRTSAAFTRQAGGHAGVHQLTGTWSRSSLPDGAVRRTGTIQLAKDGTYIEGFSSQEQIELSGVDTLQCVIQIEMANAQNLREWFL
jgi:hypothetical protein